jgi:hypothetical protein
LNIFGKWKTNSTATGPKPRSARLHSRAWPTPTALAQPVGTAHSGGGGVKGGTRAPTAERLPTRHGVEAIAHWSSLSTGRGRKTGSMAAFSDVVRAPVAGGGPTTGRRERELGSTLHGRKSGKKGLRLRSPWKSSRRRRRPDSDGGVLGQRRSASDMDDSAVEQRGGGRGGCRDAGARSRQRP